MVSRPSSEVRIALRKSSREEIGWAGQPGGQVTRIAGEDLVGAHAAEDHRELLARGGADQVGRDRRGIGDRLVHVPDELGQEIDDLRREHALAMVEPQLSAEAARVAEIVGDDLVREVLLAEADRVGRDAR